MTRKSIKNIGTVVLCTSFLAFSCSCSTSDNVEEDVQVEGEVAVHITTFDQSSLLKELDRKLPFSDTGSSEQLLEIDQQTIGKPIVGFGASLTGSSAYLLNGNDEGIDALFGKDGIDLSFIRLTVGASDFNKIGSYTYNDIDTEEDVSLSAFTLEKDKLQDNPIIPVAKEIVNKNTDISIMASPWTAPAWMKTSKSFIKGSLMPEYYDTYANYFVKYLEGYQAEGIKIGLLTVQNEPLYEPSTYPGMYMSAEDQAAFIGGNLGPKLAEAGLSTDIVAYDHNYWVEDDPDYPLTVLKDEEAEEYISGVGYHAYGGNPSDMDQVVGQFPDKDIYFTEQSGIIGDNTTFKGEVVWMMQNVFVPVLRRGGRGILLWNLALDENNGPQNNGCDVCRGVITVRSNGTIQKNPEYYLLGHFSKFVQPGAKQLSTPDFKGKFENVAFRNPDGSKALILLNTSNTTQSITIKTGEQFFDYALPIGALTTLTWK